MPSSLPVLRYDRTSALQSRLLVAFGIASGITVLEIVGGVLSNSLALLGDAGHTFTDTLAIALSVIAIRLAVKPHTGTLTYGYHRAEILAALANGIILIIVSVYIFYDAYRRLIQPPAVQGLLLLAVSTIGLVGNLIMTFILRQGSEANLNVRGAFLHVVGDTLSSVGVIFGAVVVLSTGLLIVDPIVGALIGILILKSAVSLSRDSVAVLLEGAPRHLKVERITGEIVKVEGVKAVHDLHVWTITSGFHVLSGHLVVEDQPISQASEILSRVNSVLRQRFGIGHTTLQLEISAPDDIKWKTSFKGKVDHA